MAIRPLFFHIESGSFGGGSKMLLRLLTSFSEDEFNPILLTQDRGRLAAEASSAGIDVRVVPFRGALDTYDHRLFDLPLWKKGAAALRILQFNIEARSILAESDVVWCQNLRALLTLFPHTPVTRTPIIWNIGLGMSSQGVVKYLNDVALRLCDRVFIESREQIHRVFTESQYQTFNDKFVVFHKGIDTGRFDPEAIEDGFLEGDELKIGTAASLVPRKGQDVFIEAAAQCIDQTDEEIQFYIAGDVRASKDESYRDELLNLIEEHNLQDQVTLLGWVDDMPQYLKSLDIFVLASNNEGIPGAVREALAMEVPVVATDVGGTAEAVIEGENGFLIEPENAEVLAEKIFYLSANRTEQINMGKQGREHIVEKFSIDSYVDNYEQFFERITFTNPHE